jgi:hypothetical protein
LVSQQTAPTPRLIEISQESTCPAARPDLRLLTPWTAHNQRHPGPIPLPREGFPPRPLRTGSATANMGRYVLDAVLSQQRFQPGAIVSPIGAQSFQVGTRLQLSQPIGCHLLVVPAVGSYLNLGNEQHLVLRIGGLGQVGHIAPMPSIPLLSVGPFPDVGRLQAMGTQLPATLHRDLPRRLSAAGALFPATAGRCQRGQTADACRSRGTWTCPCAERCVATNDTQLHHPRLQHASSPFLAAHSLI